MLETAERARVRIGAFVLDRSRGVLLDESGGAVALRPKAWAMLNFLVDHAGQVVEREALLDAVWPDVTVTDDSVTQCIAELRRALGEQGPKWLRTVPRRGYILDVAVEADAPAPTPGKAADGPHTPPPPVPGPVDPPATPSRSGRVPRLALAAGGLGAAVVLAALMLWPGAKPPGPPAPPVAVAPAQPTPLAESPREQARRLYRDGLIAMEMRRERGGHWLTARAFFERAIAIDPDWAPPYSVAIYTYANMVNGRFSANPDADTRAAELLLERVLSLRPDAWQTHNAHGAVLRMQRKYPEALAAYRRVIDINPSVLPARANIGLMLILLGRAAEAIEPLRTTIAMATPDNIFMAYWQACLGVALLHAEAEDFGAEAFRNAAGDAALLPGIHRDLHLAAALALSGENHEATTVFNEIRRRAPELNTSAIREAGLSTDPGYTAQREALFRGLAIVGMK